MYKHSLGFRLNGLAAMVQNRLHRRPLSVTLELTRRCIARCDYCNHWKEPPQPELEPAEFAKVIEHFQPWTVTLCGGEPLLRPDAFEVIQAIKSLPGWRYLAIITNGWLLTDERARGLVDTGIEQINVSLNYPDARQDEDRKINGLFKRIAHVVPMMTKWGANVQLNTVLMNDNLDDAAALARLAHEWGASIMYTLYSELPADNTTHLFPPERQARLAEVLNELKHLRRILGNIGNATWYLDNIPAYVSGTTIGGCQAGRATIHVSPGGMVRPCAELPVVSHYSAYDPARAQPVKCRHCFQACRGEVQAPINLGRVIEMMRS